MFFVSLHCHCDTRRKCAILTPMKSKYLMVRIEPALKTSFANAAAFNHQSLSQFLVQAGIAAVDATRAKGSRMKPAPEPRDARRK